MYSRPLLVTFDAFGTLFSPRWPIAVQYAKVAKTHGIFVLPKEIEDSFKIGKPFRIFFKRLVSLYLVVSFGQ